MVGENNLDLHFGGALHHGVKIFHFEPEQHTIAVGLVGAIGDGAVMVLDLKAVQLQDERAVFHELLVLPAAMGTSATQQALVPAAAGFDIADADERLGANVYRTIKCGCFGAEIAKLSRNKGLALAEFPALLAKNAERTSRHAGTRRRKWLQRAL